MRLRFGKNLQVVLKRAANETRSATCTLCTNPTFALRERKTKENIRPSGKGRLAARETFGSEEGKVMGSELSRYPIQMLAAWFL